MYYKMVRSRLVWIANALIAIVFFSSCETKQLFEQSTMYPSHNWSSKQANEYLFTITDTSAAYKVYFVIRHHNAYHYKNIWIQLNTIGPNDSLTKQSVNLNLADDEKGWLGTGMDDIYDQRIPISTDSVHFKKGVYKFVLSHTMREDPLENILSTGIRVEKVKP
jgi:gliding motility-associated lipoprotein GldH